MRPEKSILFALICAFCLTGCGQSAPVETTAQTEAAMPVTAAEPVVETTAPAETKPQEDETKTKKDTGKLTKEAFVKAVQKAVGVAVDGVAGSKTLAACPMLKNGSKGSVVKLVQRALVDLYGCKMPKYGADGEIGSETVAAVKSFQKSKGLTVDGIVGAKTWKKLLA